MKITDVKVKKFSKKNGSLKGFARVTLDESIVLTGIKVIKGNKGLFVSMPQTYSEKDDEWYDIFFPITAEFREKLVDAILEAYKDADKKGKKSDEDDD